MPKPKRAPDPEEELRLATELEIRAALLRYQALTRRRPIAVELQRDLENIGPNVTVRLITQEN